MGRYGSPARATTSSASSTPSTSTTAVAAAAASFDYVHQLVSDLHDGEEEENHITHESGSDSEDQEMPDHPHSVEQPLVGVCVCVCVCVSECVCVQCGWLFCSCKLLFVCCCCSSVDPAYFVVISLPDKLSHSYAHITHMRTYALLLALSLSLELLDRPRRNAANASWCRVRSRCRCRPQWRCARHTHPPRPPLLPPPPRRHRLHHTLYPRPVNASTPSCRRPHAAAHASALLPTPLPAAERTHSHLHHLHHLHRTRAMVLLLLLLLPVTKRQSAHRIPIAPTPPTPLCVFPGSLPQASLPPAPHPRTQVPLPAQCSGKSTSR
jgi:hypothetical protein